VEVGGEVRASGKNEKWETWKVGIENPNNENNLQAVVSLGNKSLATSGSYRKFFIQDGQKYSHAIDPHLGKPVAHNMLSMTVLANTCAEADAFATAFLVMGLEKAKYYAKKEKIDFLAIYEQNNQINTFATAGMKSVILEDNQKEPQ
jgi:thiamine biosynthesis lipoprotein